MITMASKGMTAAEHRNMAIAAVIEYCGSATTPKEADDYLRRGDFEFYADTTILDIVYDLVDNGVFFSIPTPDDVKAYLDYDAIARDLKLSGYSEFCGGVLLAR